MSEDFILGVNYWPRRKAMYWWKDFDPGEVREEFSLIRDLGLSLVRIFLLWEDFQPEPGLVSSANLQNLRQVCDIAAENNLKLDITFFTGHMSGPNWSPAWLLHGPPLPHVRQLISQGRVVNSSYLNPYTDPLARQAERLLLTTVVSELKDHLAVGIWNLGNEPDLFARPPDVATGRSWVADMSALIRQIDPNHPITCGLHLPSLEEDNGLRADYVFGETDLAVMHSYPMYRSWARGPLDPDLVPFTCALTTAICGKPTLMEEFGGCTVAPGEPSQVWEWEAYGQPRTQFMASEEDLAAYFAAVLPKLVEVGASGAISWCFADYIPELWDKPPCDQARHERFFGLVRPDGSLKPHAEVIRAFAATQPKIQTDPARKVELGLTPDEYYQAPLQHLLKLYERF